MKKELNVRFVKDVCVSVEVRDSMIIDVDGAEKVHEISGDQRAALADALLGQVFPALGPGATRDALKAKASAKAPPAARESINADDSKEFITNKEATARFKLPKFVIYGWVKDGKLKPPIIAPKEGKYSRLRINAKLFAEWLEGERKKKPK